MAASDAAPPAAAPAAPTMRTIPLDEVLQHKSDSDCWLIIHGKVYDVTKFMSDHPGGPESMLEFAGRDATEGFEDSSHSGSARKMMAKYQIGVVEPGAAGSAAAASTATATASKAKGGGASSYLVYAVPVLILLGALYFQFVQPPAAKA